MADYCKQCSEAIFGRDGRDMADLCRPGETTWELCEGCGDLVEVDHEGVKVSSGESDGED